MVIGIYEQFPFYVCSNKMLNKDCQKDISKYLYCRDTSTPYYQGAYGNTPSLWLEKYNIIKNAIILLNNYKKSQQNQQIKDK